MSSAPVSVGRLRVADVRRDPLATRVALNRLLATAALRPPGLPPAAILVVRAFQDPLPRRLRLDHAGIRPPPEWEHAVATALDDLARSAARPAHEAVGANAAAVLFADRAELLACLLADWAAGAIESRWWWRLVVRGSPDVAVPAELRASPTYVPAAFAALADRGVAVAVAAALPLEEALATARSVAAAFGVPAPHVEPRQLGKQPTPVAVAGVSVERVSQEHDVQRSALAWSPATATLSAAVPEARASGLRAEQRLLLAVALGLRREPAALRLPAEPAPEPPPLPARSTPASQRSAVTLAAAAAEAHPPAGLAPAPPPPRREDGFAAATGAERNTGMATPATATPGSPPARSHPDAEGPPVAVEPTIAPPSAPSDGQETASGPRPAIARTRRERAAASAREIPPAPSIRPDPAALPEQHAPDIASLPLLGPAVETRLGGLFFLVNAGIDLGLYGDFTQPSRPGIALDLWDFLTLVGLRLARGEDDDPVWRLLAELAGREPEDPAGAGFVPPGGRTLADWSDDAADEIRTVLAAADLTPRRLLRRPAAVHVTDAHVDVVFSLAGHPLEIRIAGLDRDPGFVPAAGRHVAFHFE